MLSDLISFDTRVAPTVAVWQISNTFKSQPDLPGMLIIDDKQLIGIIPRDKCFEQLGRPYGVELFRNRPVIELYNRLGIQPLVLPYDCRVDEAVQTALTRKHHQLYDPVVMQREDGQYAMIDMHTLLTAQNELLRKSNNVIQKQAEISLSLSTTLHLQEVVRLILQHIAEMVPYDWAVIITEKDGEVDYSLSCGLPAEIDIRQIHAVYKEQSLYAQLFREKRPVLIPEIQASPPLPTSATGTTLSSWLCIPLIHASNTLGILTLARTGSEETIHPEKTGAFRTTNNGKNHSFSQAELDLLMNLQSTFTIAIRNAQLYSQVQESSLKDTLTNINNRRGFFEFAQREIANASSTGQLLCALMIDIDHFKKINDAYGHAVGDQVIRAVARECNKVIRQSDLLGRYGGEEFVILLPSSDLETARRVAERIRSDIEALVIAIDGVYIRVSVSIGLAQQTSVGSPLDDLLNRADQALYAAKYLGRNRVVVWDEALQFHLENDLLQDTKNNLLMNTYHNQSQKRLDSTVLEETIEGWAKALELRDRETEGHGQRVARLTVELAKRLNIPEEERIHIQRGALLHDIGKIAIPDNILFKPGKLTEEEWAIMRKHPFYAYELLAPIAQLRPAIDIPYCHHELWNGSGYPRGLKGEEIPLSARIFTVIDVWDALRSDRCYRPAWETEKIFAYLQDGAGKLFDPRVVQEFFALLKDLDITNGGIGEHPFFYLNRQTTLLRAPWHNR
ncbi:MAG: diguanylate cyclase [Anaerolineae bacterium]|nr:diguanylate cyclase [Anaerolineae bacterium]